MTKCDDGEIKQSLADRLRALQINQENWKNRINKSNEIEINTSFKKRFSLGDDIFKKAADCQQLAAVQQQEKITTPQSNQHHLTNKFSSDVTTKVQTTKLADRMLLLEKSAKQWKNRVADKDNQKFTFSGKMASLDVCKNSTKKSITKPIINTTMNNVAPNNKFIHNNNNNNNNNNSSTKSIELSNSKNLKKDDLIKKYESLRPADLSKYSSTKTTDQSIKKNSNSANSSIKSIFSAAKSELSPKINTAPIKTESIFKRDLNVTTATTTTKSNERTTITKSNTQTTCSTKLTKQSINEDVNLSSIDNKTTESKVEILKLDDSFDKFFKPIKLEKVLSPNEEKDDFLDDFDQMNSSLLVIKKNVKLKNRKKASTGNPLKKSIHQNMTNNDFIQDLNSQSTNDQTNSTNYHHKSSSMTNQTSTSQSSSIYSTKYLSNYHQPPSTITGTSTKISSTIRKDLDPTAKAGLESKEDYQSVANKLKSADGQEYLDSNNLLTNKKAKRCLIQIKGRKKVQVRIVEPSLESINEGDSYVLIANNVVIAWIGRFSNIIERTKAIEVANKIIKRKGELGFICDKLIKIDNDKNPNLNDINAFKNLLKDDSSNSIEDVDFNVAGNEEEDELYENQIIKTNKVYIFDQEKQVFSLYDSMCSRQLYQQQLNPYDAFLFDFTDELYVWLGFHLSNDTRTIAIEKAQEFYSQFDRSNYCIFYKCNQNMELITFQEKFFDWTHNYKHKSKSNGSSTMDEHDKRMNLKTFDIDEMLKEPDMNVDFILDNTNIGRGDYFKDDNELLYIEVVTDNIKCWHINEYEKKEITDQDLGQFFDTETYVVRWEYRINRLGNLEGKKFGSFRSSSSASGKSKSNNSNDDESIENIFKKAQRINIRKHKETLDNNVTGRERFCYFYWQGSNCSIANKGAAALMAIELDKEKGTQIQIKQSEEIPCFLRLFKGKFVIFNNRLHQNIDDKNPNRLFLVKGVDPEEAFLYEVKFDVNSLRSKGCFVLVNFKLRKLWLWIGKSTTKDQVKIANDICQNINQHGFSTLSSSLHSTSKFTHQTVKQTYENLEFLDQFNETLSQTRSVIRHLVIYDMIDQECAIFHLTSLSGEFTFQRLICTYSSNDVVNSFPFEQKQIYSVSQPAFFLIDNGQIIYLWQGHFPIENDDHKLTGSVKVRYSQEKKCALETAISYSHKKYQSKSIEVYLIHAGLEPIEFIQLFPEWRVYEEIKELQLKDGKKEGEMSFARDVLARVCNLKNVYKLDDLKRKPLPDGINPLIIETYLSDQEFEKVLKMNKKNFYKLPIWKQNKLKQLAGLF